IHRHRRLEQSVRQLREAFGPAAHADVPLDVIVPRREVRITDRPVDGDTITQVRLEIEVAPAIDLTPPDDRLAAELPRPKPVERLVGWRRVRVVNIVRPESPAHFVERHGSALDRLSGGDR